MAKLALIAVLALFVAVATANPLGGAVISQNHHVSSSVVSPHLGFGMMGYPGVIGHSHVSSHSSVGHHGKHTI